VRPGAGGHDLSAGGDVLDRVTATARAALRLYDASEDAEVSLLNVSENATFLVNDPATGLSVLRVHRLGYHSRPAIESELAWMDALRAEAGIRTPRVRPASDGSRVVTVPASTVPASTGPANGASRHCVRMEFLPGAEPAGAQGGVLHPAALAHFAGLGAITARMHAHARGWGRPAWFTRFRWDADAAFGARVVDGTVANGTAAGEGGRWGRWRDGVGVGAAEAGILARLEERLRERLGAFGTRPEKFGLIHADTRLANLLLHDGTTAVIDFDDCGFGWYLYDLGTTVSFFEDDPAVPGLVAAWLDGYRAGGGVLAADDLAEAWTFIAFRRLLLTAWIGSHPAAAGAADLGADYTRGTCDLAEKYLSGHLDAGRLLAQIPGDQRSRDGTERGLEVVHIGSRAGGRHHRRQPRHRQGHRGGVRPGRGEGTHHRPR
jgi:Ser/Thr protein kinase RdoA (MazF antagonist)